jgi:hypothetical protein
VLVDTSVVASLGERVANAFARRSMPLPRVMRVRSADGASRIA